jgi:hypothetical protein
MRGCRRGTRCKTQGIRRQGRFRGAIVVVFALFDFGLALFDVEFEYILEFFDDGFAGLEA